MTVISQLVIVALLLRAESTNTKAKPQLKCIHLFKDAAKKHIILSNPAHLFPIINTKKLNYFPLNSTATNITDLNYTIICYNKYYNFR